MPGQIEQENKHASDQYAPRHAAAVKGASHDTLSRIRESRAYRWTLISVGGLALAGSLAPGVSAAARYLTSQSPNRPAAASGIRPGSLDGADRGSKLKAEAPMNIDYSATVAKIAREPIPAAVRRAALSVNGVMTVFKKNGKNNASEGSGFPVRQDGKVIDITAQHVATNDGRNTVPNETFVDARNRQGEVVAIPIQSERLAGHQEEMTNGDIAELNVGKGGVALLGSDGNKAISPLRFAKGKAPKGSIAYVLGKTMPNGDYSSRNPTTVTPVEVDYYGKLPGSQYGGVVFTPVAPNGETILPGDSGAPIVNSSGEVIGVVTASKYTDPAGIEIMGGPRYTNLGASAPILPVDAGAATTPANIAMINSDPTLHRTQPPFYYLPS
jgi:Trypsin-like peptidase domain